jgi:hypothetical protein
LSQAIAHSRRALLALRDASAHRTPAAVVEQDDRLTEAGRQLPAREWEQPTVDAREDADEEHAAEARLRERLQQLLGGVLLGLRLVVVAHQSMSGAVPVVRACAASRYRRAARRREQPSA